MTHFTKLTILCKSVLYTFQSGLCSLDADYNGMQALSSVTAPGELDGQVEEKEEEVEKEEKEEEVEKEEKEENEEKEEKEKEEKEKGNVDENSTSHEISSQDGANSSGSQLALSQSSVDFGGIFYIHSRI